MSKRSWMLFLADMIESAHKALQYVHGLDFQEFVRDSKTQDAVVRNLEVLGEAAKRIPPRCDSAIPKSLGHKSWACAIALSMATSPLTHASFGRSFVWNYRRFWRSCENCKRKGKDEGASFR